MRQAQGGGRAAGTTAASGLGGAGPVHAPGAVARLAEHTVLHQIVRDHLATFLRAAADRTGGNGLPAFIEREFRDFITCGVWARGFASTDP